jgi:hypothetical protein
MKLMTIKIRCLPYRGEALARYLDAVASTRIRRRRRWRQAERTSKAHTSPTLLTFNYCLGNGRQMQRARAARDLIQRPEKSSDV